MNVFAFLQAAGGVGEMMARGRAAAAPSHQLGQGSNMHRPYDVVETTSGVGKVCPVCGKQFHGRNRRQNLEHHLVTHTGERRYSCPLCPHRAAHKWHLKTHILRRHAQHPALSQVAATFQRTDNIQNQTDASSQHVEV